MTLVRISDLIGKPVAGVQCDLRSRNADGSLMYASQEEMGPRIARLKAVEVRREKGHRWMYWTWEKTRQIPFDCGYSGIRMDSEYVGDYHLLMNGGKPCE